MKNVFKSRLTTTLLLILSGLILSGCASRPDPVAYSEFVQAEGRNLVLKGEQFRFNAISFGNEYGRKVANYDQWTHHSEIDFQRVRGLGFNSIRFGMNGNWYQQDPRRFMAWLDQNVQWATKAGVYLILDLHVPIGSFWLDPTSKDVSFAIWEDPVVRQQNIDFWRVIANRYKDNPQVAAYDVINEPVTTDSDGKQWRRLALDLVSAIRQVDPNHLLVIERLYGVNKKYGHGDVPSQFLVPDNNVVYDFHFYEPIEYTHQGAVWLSSPLGDGGIYPDPNALTPTGRNKPDWTATLRSLKLKTGTSNWHRYESSVYRPLNRKIVAAAPQMSIKGDVSGKIEFRNLSVIEIAPDGTETVVLHEPLTKSTVWQWHGWAVNNRKNSFKSDRDELSGDNHLLRVEIDKPGSKSLAGWSSDRSWLRVKRNHQYKIIGSMRGEDVSYGNNKSAVRFEVNFYEPVRSGVPVFNARDKNYLQFHLDKYAKFGEKYNVPMSVLETGIVSSAFGPSGKGAEYWVSDLLELLGENNISYGLWNYHGDQMGIFRTPVSQAPGDPNRTLIDELLRLQQGNERMVFSTKPMELPEVASMGIAPVAALRTTANRRRSDDRPPGNLAIDNVPQFVVIGFDDNTTVEGISWALDLFSSRRNPAGLGNSATFDSTGARASFYMNTKGFHQGNSPNPNGLIAATRELYKQGHEIGNHTWSHHSDINSLPWDDFQNRITDMPKEKWQHRIERAQQDLVELSGIPESAIVGFRAPYLAYTQNMLDALDRDFAYDCSIEEGYAKQYDGTNFRWPYQMLAGSPGHIESWRGSKYNPKRVDITSSELWQLPNHVLLVPEDQEAARYGIPARLWERMKMRQPSLTDRKITGFDYNLWVNAGLSAREVAGLLKYNLDLRISGNRAPFMFGAHSQYYTDEQWASKNVPNATAKDMRRAIKSFVDYALSKPMVRVRTGKDVIDWMRSPTGLRTVAEASTPATLSSR